MKKFCVFILIGLVPALGLKKPMDFVNPNVPNDVKLQPGKKCFCMPTYFLNTFSNRKVPNDVRLPSRNYVCGPESN